MKCPTCGAPTTIVNERVTWPVRDENGNAWGTNGAIFPKHTYEPLGLDALERAIVTTSVGVAYFEQSLSENPNQPSVEQGLKVAKKAWRISVDQLLTARAATKVGTE